jgi:hypothetical protein
LVSRIGVVDVHVEEGWEQVALAGARHHDQRVTDADLRWAVRSITPLAPKTTWRKSTCAAMSLKTMRGVTE